MVARFYGNMQRCRKRHRMRRLRLNLITVALLALVITSVQAQHFLNGRAGTYKGPGLFQVKGIATGLPDTVTGTFEYFGGNQKVEAKNYENLLLAGNGIKNSTANNLNIIQSVGVTSGVNFQIESSMILGELSGRITRENGVVTGRIYKTVDFNALTDTSDFGAIGLSIYSNGSALGRTDVIRTSGSNIVSSIGSESIKRYYEIYPTETLGLSGSIYFRYSTEELAGQDPSRLDIWRSPDYGSTWRRQRTIHNNNNELVRAGKFLQGTWTAADPDHLLGLANYEFDPEMMFAAGADSLKGKVRRPLDSLFTAKITDVYGNPILGAQVRFLITQNPDAATNYTLSNVLATTDSGGNVSTQLTLGSKKGLYKVTAQVESVPTTRYNFIGYADHGDPVLAWKDNIVRQDTFGRILPEFTYTITDSDTNAVPGRSVRFTLIQPNGTIADSTMVLTDSLGQAKAIFRYGNLAGNYIVSAEDINLPGSKLNFPCKALHGLAKTLAQQSGNSQFGQLGERLQPFVVQVRDAGGNFVPNTGVTFKIYSRPDSLTRLDSLTTNGRVSNDSIFVTTDSLGLASVSLILGSRPGRYKVKASIAGVGDTTFVADAILLYADVNHDNYRNIGDLTAILDHALGRKLLTGYEFLNGDMYPRHADGTVGDGIIDIRDVQVCRDSLLKSGWNPTGNWLNTFGDPSLSLNEGSVPLSSGSTFVTSKTDSCFVQTTYIGSRFSIKNAVPIKGLQAVIYMKNVATLDTTDIIYTRASMMRADVMSVGKKVNVVLWNFNNSPIEPGDAPIFRLPIQLTNEVDSIHVLMSSGSNNEVLLVNSVREDIRNSIPRDWMLYQNYPNPFNPTTTIQFDVPEVAGRIPRVAIQIFNILGQRVRTLERGIHEAGRYSVKWDGLSENGTRISSGVYFYRLLAGEYAITKKMVMLK